MNREQIISFALTHARRLIGMKYSRTYRYKYYPTGSADCSSYMFGCWLAAGVPFLVKGKEQTTSCYEVNAEDFELVYPETHAMIGKPGCWAPKGFYRTFAWEPGDIIFYNFNVKTARANKITHVSMCWDKDTIIHTANVRENACMKPMSYGDGHILAVMRLGRDAVAREAHSMTKKNASKTDVRRMQTLLNVFGEDPKLVCDGIWGRATASALAEFKKHRGLGSVGICCPDTWTLLLGGISGEDADCAGEAGKKPVFARELGYTYISGIADYMRGADVRALQELLTAAGMTPGKCDGIFGKKTLKALKDFQCSRGLKESGTADEATITALGGEWSAE